MSLGGEPEPAARRQPRPLFRSSAEAILFLQQLGEHARKRLLTALTDLPPTLDISPDPPAQYDRFSGVFAHVEAQLHVSSG